MENKNLTEAVAEVKASTFLGHPLSESIQDAVFQRDRPWCIALLASEDLWDGARGWTLPKDIWDTLVFVWRNVPEFFKEYDPDREIVEDSSKWTQRYFDDQRNYLRHNFCLERLCHLVMVYEALHGEKFNDRGRMADLSGSIQAAPSVRRSESFVEMGTPNRASATKRLHRYVTGVCVVFVATAILLFLSCQAGWRKASDARHMSDGERANKEMSGGRNE